MGAWACQPITDRNASCDTRNQTVDRHSSKPGETAEGNPGWRYRDPGRARTQVGTMVAVAADAGHRFSKHYARVSTCSEEMAWRETLRRAEGTVVGSNKGTERY
jgi:hypothetical protein